MQKRKILEMTEPKIRRQKKKADVLGFDLPKWVSFSELMMQKGFRVLYYEAIRTVSKYVIVTRGEKKFMVRFSNHKPSIAREARQDCDFFVGVTNFGVTRTNDAIKATLEYFGD